MKDVPIRPQRDRLDRLADSIAKLAGEARQLNMKLDKFKKGRQIHPHRYYYSMDPDARDPHAKTETEEPKSAIRDVLYYSEAEGAELVAYLLSAIARDADGAFRDIRAIRADIEAIKDDSDLRAEFKAWQRWNQ